MKKNLNDNKGHMFTFWSAICAVE